VVIASREGGASLNILSGLVAKLSAFWIGLAMVALMGIAYDQHPRPVDHHDRVAGLRVRPVAFGFLGMGP
jgi:K(+)-stimulated pyrophosphate-energized sodium pump